MENLNIFLLVKLNYDPSFSGFLFQCFLFGFLTVLYEIMRTIEYGVVSLNDLKKHFSTNSSALKTIDKQTFSENSKLRLFIADLIVYITEYVMVALIYEAFKMQFSNLLLIVFGITIVIFIFRTESHVAKMKTLYEDYRLYKRNN